MIKLVDAADMMKDVNTYTAAACPSGKLFSPTTSMCETIVLGTASAITGVTGSPFPAITITGSTLPDGYPLKFTPAGSTATISGTYTAGKFVPDAGSVIPMDATLGSATGTLAAIGASTTVATTFTGVMTVANVTTASCTPTSITIGEKLTCTAAFPAGFAGPLTFDAGNGQMCTVTVTTTMTTASCDITVTTPIVNGPITLKDSANSVKPAGTYTAVDCAAGKQYNTVTKMCEAIVLGTAAAITGVIGDPMPTITLTGSNLADGTIVSFTPAGSTTPILMMYNAGTLTPEPGSKIPADATLGSQTGTIAIQGVTTTVPTNFKAAIKVSDITSTTCTPATVTIGEKVTCTLNFPVGLEGTMTIDAGNGQMCTVAITTTMTTASCDIVIVTPINNGSIGIKDNSGATMTTTNKYTAVGCPTNKIFNTVIKMCEVLTMGIINDPIVGLPGGTIAPITLIGSNIPNGTPMTLTLPGVTTPITGKIMDGKFVPDAGQTIPNTVTMGNSAYAVLTGAGTTANIPTNFTCTDCDFDTVPDAIEDAAPNNGDGNNDGIKDSKQSSVSSVKTDKGYVTIVSKTTACSTLQNAKFVTESQQSAADSLYEYPFGLISFDVDCANEIEIDTYWHDITDTAKSYIWRKAINGKYITHTGATTVNKIINGKTVVVSTHKVKDSSEFDANTATGKIRDPFGPAIDQLIPIVTTGGTTSTPTTTTKPNTITPATTTPNVNILATTGSQHSTAAGLILLVIAITAFAAKKENV
jgi:hypothetical protein